MKQVLLFLLLAFPMISIAQDCDCTSNFNWTKEIFEENDAGFAFALEKKGQAAYDQHNKIIAKKASSTTSPLECSQVLYEWLTFFRSGHIAIRTLNQEAGQSEGRTSDEEIINRFSDWEKLEVDVAEFSKHLETKKNIDFEGIWVSGPYEIGVKKVADGYVGFIIKADGIYWTEGQVKLKINKDNSSTYYMQDHSGQDFASTELLGSNYLSMGFINLERKNPVAETDPNVKRYFKTMKAQGPYFEEVDESTVLLRIPSFNGSVRSEINSVIDANRAKILSTPNLIIDIRNNGGGSDISYYGLLPLIYTNPIRTVGVELLSTELNNKRMLAFSTDDSYGYNDDEKKWARESYEELSKHLGEFVMLNDEPVSVNAYDTIYPYPKNVGIIINENNGSTTEQFLLAARQSKKVKTFGTTTVGVLDISNMYFVKSPCEEFELGYSLSKSMRLPEMPIDDIGIQPDFFIHKSVPKYEWIDFVTKILAE